jgi:P-type E1-E2 ATPase
VRPGEVVPVDGLTVTPATLDEAALTGEARPVDHPAGEKVSSGTVNAGPPFELRATATAQDSTYAGIVRLVREAQESKAPFVRMADRYALVFLPLTLLVAAAAWIVSGDPVRALSVLVVATPCPLILAAPVAIVSGISRAARRGIIVKGGAALEALATVRILLVDKTGTLTAGMPSVRGVPRPARGLRAQAEASLRRRRGSPRAPAPGGIAGAGLVPRVCGAHHPCRAGAGAPARLPFRC